MSSIVQGVLAAFSQPTPPWWAHLMVAAACAVVIALILVTTSSRPASPSTPRARTVLYPVKDFSLTVGQYQRVEWSFGGASIELTDIELGQNDTLLARIKLEITVPVLHGWRVVRHDTSRGGPLQFSLPKKGGDSLDWMVLSMLCDVRGFLSLFCIRVEHINKQERSVDFLICHGTTSSHKAREVDS